VLLIGNGGFKTGSTWVYALARDLLRSRDLPSHLRREDWKNSSFAFERTDEVLEFVEQSGGRYHAKVHFNRPAERERLLEAGDFLKVLTVLRDPRDIVVSAFFHYERHKKVDPETTFAEFFWAERKISAASVLRRYREYAETWAIDSPNVFRTSYERLSSAPGVEVRRLANTLGVHVSNEKVANTVSRSSFENMGGGVVVGHRRKGTVGDHESHFTEDMHRHFEQNPVVLDLYDRWNRDLPELGLIAETGQ